MAATLRIILSTILYLINKDEEAEFHLTEGLREARQTKNALAIFFAAGPLSFKNLHANNGVSKAYDLLRKAFKDAAPSGFIRQLSSPWIVELFYEFERHGFEPLPQLSLQEIKERAVNDGPFNTY